MGVRRGAQISMLVDLPIDRDRQMRTSTKLLYKGMIQRERLLLLLKGGTIQDYSQWPRQIKFP